MKWFILVQGGKSDSALFCSISSYRRCHGTVPVSLHSEVAVFIIKSKLMELEDTLTSLGLFVLFSTACLTKPTVLTGQSPDALSFLFCLGSFAYAMSQPGVFSASPPLTQIRSILQNLYPVKFPITTTPCSTSSHL